MLQERVVLEAPLDRSPSCLRGPCPDQLFPVFHKDLPALMKQGTARGLWDRVKRLRSIRQRGDEAELVYHREHFDILDAKLRPDQRREDLFEGRVSILPRGVEAQSGQYCRSVLWPSAGPCNFDLPCQNDTLLSVP